jgi:hypothetical protein
MPLDLAIGSLASFNGIRRGNLRKEQRDALKKMAAWFKKHDAHEIPKLPISDVQEFILNFSQVFFLADLTPEMIDIEYVAFGPEETLNKYGHQKHIDGRSEIRIDERDWSEEKMVEDHKTALLGTTLHECIHAYFCAFCCNNPHHEHAPYGLTSECKTDGVAWHIGHGHFAAWFHLAAGVDIALEKLLEWKTDLAVFRAVLNEYSSPCGVRFHPAEWRRFFENFSWKDIDRLVGKLYECEFKQLGEILREYDDVANVIIVEYRKEVARLRAVSDAS